jgi:tetratricopeptide (TPR) repeat protein
MGGFGGTIGAGEADGRRGGGQRVRERVAIYCRLSEEDKNKQNATDDSGSIQNQKAMLRDYAERMGWEIYGIYSDDDYANAIDAYTNAIRFGGFLYESLLNRGICYIQLNKYNEAKADLKRVIDECSDSDLVESASKSYEPIKNITIITKG